MQNPFDDEEALFHAVVNAEGQHALWPVFAEVPAGWEVILRERSRRECLDHIERNWTDIRPLSLNRE